MTNSSATETKKETMPKNVGKIDKARALPVLALDFGNGSTCYAYYSDGELVSGSVPSLYLETNHPASISINDKNFVYGANAAKLSLDTAFNPGLAGSSDAKSKNLDLVLAAVISDLGLVTGEDGLKFELRIATPTYCQSPAHDELKGTHLVKLPESKGGHSRFFDVRSVTSYQECRPIVMKYGGCVDCGNGTTFLGWMGASGQPTINSIDSGVSAVLERVLGDEKIASRMAGKSTGKGVLSPLGLAAALASGRAIKKDGSVIYRGVQVNDVLVDELLPYWNDVVVPAIFRVAGNIVTLDDKPTIAIVGGGAALLKSLFQDEIDSTVMPEGCKVKFIKDPAKELVRTIALAK